MAIDSAGLVVFRRRPDGPEVLLVHPGGPWWRGKDQAGWSIPKGLPEAGETLLAAALREFTEETGLPPPAAGEALTSVRNPGKTVHAWLAEGDLDLSAFHSSTFEMEWPPRSGRVAVFPEADKADWFARDAALHRIHRGQRPLLEEAFRRMG